MLRGSYNVQNNNRMRVGCEIFRIIEMNLQVPNFSQYGFRPLVKSGKTDCVGPHETNDALYAASSRRYSRFAFSVFCL